MPAATTTPARLLIVLTVASALTLAFLWWSPLGSLSAAVALLCAQSVAGYEFTQAAVWAVVIASFATVAFDQWKRAVWRRAFVVALGLIVVFVTYPELSWQSAISTWASLSLVWVVAVVIRIYRGSIERAERRAALFAADREARAREAVAEERARLARELHDSVGHALNVVVLHAGAAQRVIEKKPELAREALESIETAGRQALGDIERMLGILRAREEVTSYDVAPGMGQLETLCGQVREAGLPVELIVEGVARPLPASLDLTAYRIVQEALTNTLKHAGKTRATVHVRYEERCSRHRGARRGSWGHVRRRTAAAAASWACANGWPRSGESSRRDRAPTAASAYARGCRWPTKMGQGEARRRRDSLTETEGT